MEAFITRTKRKAEEFSKEEEKPLKEPKAESFSNHFSWPFPIKEPSFSLVNGIQNNGKEMKKHGDLDLLIFQPLFDVHTSESFFRYLLEELPWYRVVYKVRDKIVSTPRWTCVFGLDDTAKFIEDPKGKEDYIKTKSNDKIPSKDTYKYPPRPLPSLLKEYKKLVEEKTGTDFNFCLINLYLNGKDSISFHSDDESFLGDNPTIASLSLGSNRSFHLKQKEKENGIAYRGNKSKNGGIGKGTLEKFEMKSGNLIVMRGTTQRNWLHSVPKTTKEVGPRINITLRKAMNVRGTNNYYWFNVHGNVGKANEPHRWINGEMVPQLEGVTPGN